MKKTLITIILSFIILLFPTETFAAIIDYSKVTTDIINVKNIGAKGDGVTDDTNAINAAISRSRYPNPGNVVYLPVGRYLVTGINATLLNGTTIVGDGSDKTFIISAGFEGPIIDTLGSNYLTIAKMHIGLRDNATADTGLVLGASGPTTSGSQGASSTANSIDQLIIEDSGNNSSFNISALLVANSGDNHITDSKFISRNRGTTPAVRLTGNSHQANLRSQYATVINPVVHNTHGAAAPTDNTFIRVQLLKSTKGSVGALLINQAETRFFNSKIESTDPSGVIFTNTSWRNGFYKTDILPVNQPQFSDACIKLPSQSPSVQIHGITFDPRNCNSAIGPLNFANQTWLFRVLYPNQAYSRDFKRSHDVITNNAPAFFVEPKPFPPAPSPFNGTTPTSSPTASPSPTPSPSPSPTPSPTACNNPTVDFGNWPTAGDNIVRYQVYAVVNGVEYHIGYINLGQRYYVWPSAVPGNTYRFLIKWVHSSGQVGLHTTMDLKAFCP